MEIPEETVSGEDGNPSSLQLLYAAIQNKKVPEHYIDIVKKISEACAKQEKYTTTFVQQLNTLFRSKRKALNKDTTTNELATFLAYIKKTMTSLRGEEDYNTLLRSVDFMREPPTNTTIENTPSYKALYANDKPISKPSTKKTAAVASPQSSVSQTAASTQNKVESNTKREPKSPQKGVSVTTTAQIEQLAQTKLTVIKPATKTDTSKAQKNAGSRPKTLVEHLKMLNTILRARKPPGIKQSG